MRSSIFILFISYSISVCGQFDFEANSTEKPIFSDYLEGTRLALPNYDSVLFEMRFWAFGSFGGFLQLSYSIDSTWKYNRGYYSNQDLFKSVNFTNPVNVSEVWDQLIQLEILSLPDQDELVLKYHKDGKTLTLGPENELTERIFHGGTDSPSFAIELFSRGKYRLIHYIDPISLNDSFKSSGKWESKEIEIFADIVSLISKSFQMKEVFKTNFLEKYGIKE